MSTRIGSSHDTGKNDNSNNKSLHDIDYDATADAINSLMACSLASASIRKAYMKICDLEEAPAAVTKKELMVGVAREYRICKVERPSAKKKYYVADELESDSSSGFAVRSHYPSPYVRNYCNNAMIDLKKKMHPRLWTFALCKVIDLSGQLIGDRGVEDLCEHLAKSPVETIALNNNNISDKGLIALSLKIRSLDNLKSLHLAGNSFRDEGVEALFHGDRYSPTLRLLNLSENHLGTRSAWAIGMMFYPSRQCELDELNVGGQCHIRYSIDNFLCALVPHLVLPGNRCVRKLHVGHAGVTDVGLAAVLNLLMARRGGAGAAGGAAGGAGAGAGAAGGDGGDGEDRGAAGGGEEAGVEYLVLSRSPLFGSKHRHAFLHALVANKSLSTLVIKECGFRAHEMNEIENYIRARHTATCTSDLIREVQSLGLFSSLGASKYTAASPLARKHLSLPWSAFDSAHCQWRHMCWADKLSFVRKVVAGRTNLEKLRADEERYVRDVRFAPPTVPRPTLPSRSKAVMEGSGVTRVKMYSDKVKDERNSDEAAKLAFLAKGSTITAKYHLPECITGVFIAALRREEVKNALRAKEKEEHDLAFLEETRDMSDNDAIRLRKRREDEALQESYLAMTPLQLASSKHSDDLPPLVCQAIKLVLKNSAAIDDQQLHVKELAAAARCELLKELDLIETVEIVVGGDHVGDMGETNERTASPPRLEDRSSASSALTAEFGLFNDSEDEVSSCENTAPCTPADSLAMTRAGDSMRQSVEDVIRTLVTDPDLDCDLAAGSSSGREDFSSSSSSSSSAPVVAAAAAAGIVHSAGDDVETNSFRSNASSRRSVVLSARSNLSLDEDMRAAIRRQAAALAADITRSVLKQALTRRQQQQQQEEEARVDTGEVDTEPTWEEVGSGSGGGGGGEEPVPDEIAVLARSITPSIISEAITAACVARLGDFSAASSSSNSSSSSSSSRAMASLVHALNECLSAEVVAAVVAESVCRAVRKVDSMRGVARSGPPPQGVVRVAGDIDGSAHNIQELQCQNHASAAGDERKQEWGEEERDCGMMYRDATLQDTNRGLRVTGQDGRRAKEDTTLLEYLQHLLPRKRKLEQRVSSRQLQLLTSFDSWNQDLAQRRTDAEHASSGSRGGGGSAATALARMSRQQREAWLVQAKQEREEQRFVEETKRALFFVEAEMVMEDLLSAQLELSSLLEEVLGVMVCVEVAHEDSVVQADRHQVLVTDDYISNARTMSGHFLALDVPLCYAAFSFHRSNLEDRVKSGTSIARLEALEASLSQEKTCAKIKPFNPRKGIRFRIFSAMEPKVPKVVAIDEVVNKNVNTSRRDEDDEADAPALSSAVDVFPESDTGEYDCDGQQVTDMFTPPGSASFRPGAEGRDKRESQNAGGHNDEGVGDLVESSDFFFSSEDEQDTSLSSPNKEKKKRKKKEKKEKKVAMADEAGEWEGEGLMTPEERKAAARERKRERCASRERERQRAGLSSASRDQDQDLDGDASPNSRLLHCTSFSFSEVSENELESSRDELDSPARQAKRRRKKNKVKKPAQEECPPPPEEEEEEKEPEPETLAQRRVRQRAEAKALRLTEEQARAAMLPPIPTVKKEEVVEMSPTKAQRRMAKKAARKEAEEEARLMAKAEGGAGSALLDCPDFDSSAASRGPMLSKGGTFRSLRNLFAREANQLEAEKVKPPTDVLKLQLLKEKSVKVIKVDPPHVLDIYVPPSVDGSLRLRVKFVDAFRVLPGFYIIGFQPQCAARGLLKERDKIESIGGSPVAGLSLNEVEQLMDKDKDKGSKRAYVLFVIKRVADKPPPPPLPSNSGSGSASAPLCAQVVTQQMISDQAAEVVRAHEAKRKVKRTIRAWTRDFERDFNRKVALEDERANPDVFRPLAQWFTYISEQEETLDRMKIDFESARKLEEQKEEEEEQKKGKGGK